MRTKKYFAAILSIILFAVSGCAGNTDQQIKNLVLQYNDNLTEALKKSDPEVLKEFAVERERGRIQIYIAQLADENKIIDSRLKSINFMAAKIIDDKEWQEIISRYEQQHQRDAKIPGAGTLKDFKQGHAIVNTEEQWNYQYIDPRSNSRIGQPELLGYNVTYIIVREDNKWKVADVQFEEKQIKP